MDKHSKAYKTDINLPLISVIVPVYNGQECLDNCIRSIAGQTYDNLEILIVNDGSTDATDLVCNKLKEEYSNVILLHTGGKGVSAARNAALDVCRGGYISFVDADDRILPHMLELLYRDLTETQSDVAGCSFFEWSSERSWTTGGTSDLTRTLDSTRPLEPESNRGSKSEKGNGPAKEGDHGLDRKLYHKDTFLREGLLGSDTRCWSKLYKREAVQAVRFREDITIGEDILFLVDMLPHITRIVTSSYEGYGYYNNPKGAMNQTFKPSYMDQITCWETVREELIRFAEEDKDLINRKATANLMMAVLLIVGKIAVLPKEEWNSREKYINRCHDKIKENMKNKDAFALLPSGYKVKTLFFLKARRLYMYSYSLMKRRNGN